MTVQTLDSAVSYTGDGSTSAFPFSFVVLDAGTMYGTINGVATGGSAVVNADQSVSPGGVFTFDVIPDNGTEVTVFRDITPLQSTAYPPLSPFPSEAHESALDKLTLIDQQIVHKFNLLSAEFEGVQEVTSYLALSDTPSSYGGQTGKAVVVKGDESGLEFVTLMAYQPSLAADWLNNSALDGTLTYSAGKWTADLGTSTSNYGLVTNGVWNVGFRQNGLSMTVGFGPETPSTSIEGDLIADLYNTTNQVIATLVFQFTEWGAIKTRSSNINNSADLDYKEIRFREIFLYNEAPIIYDITFMDNLSPETTFLALEDTPGMFSGAANQFVTVNSAETALEFSPKPSTTFIGGTDTPASYATHAGKATVVNGASNGLEFIELRFTGMLDTPANYTGQGGRSVRVNAGATALEFFDLPPAGVTTFTGLTDTPASYATHASKTVKVNAAGTALEFVTVAGGGVSTFLGLTDTPASYTNNYYLRQSATGVVSDSNLQYQASTGLTTAPNLGGARRPIAIIPYHVVANLSDDIYEENIGGHIHCTAAITLTMNDATGNAEHIGSEILITTTAAVTVTMLAGSTEVLSKVGASGGLTTGAATLVTGSVARMIKVPNGWWIEGRGVT